MQRRSDRPGTDAESLRYLLVREIAVVAQEDRQALPLRECKKASQKIVLKRVE
jgi:hypothetical protein